MEATEQHYRVNEIAAAWGFCRNTITRMFKNEPGVLRVGDGERVVLSVPASVMLRVHERLGNKPLQAGLSSPDPLRVEFLRDRNGRVAKKPRNIIKLHAGKKARNIIKLHAGKKLPHREGIA